MKERTYWREFPGNAPEELPRDRWLEYADGLELDSVVENGFVSRFGTRYWTELEK